MEREVVLTEEGFQKLKEEIEYLSTIKRREVAERIKEAREFGDISENSEYDDAKNEQAQLEARILGLEQKLRNARVVDAEHVSTESVSIGARVTLKDLSTKKNVEYSIVGSAEADPRNHRLSNESPVGKAVLGRKKGEKVTVPTPRGPVEFQIMKIQPGLAH
ncbi:MAG TPA: transcription elongation factor GreA [Miltoncostaeaceae bacterium]|nr:transcription elongation factor GreA [Miltoncostaeaceae bacterium]